VKKVLGIDFGTTHSYFAKSQEDRPSPESIDLSSSSSFKGIDTVVLYEPDGTTLIGEPAIYEYVALSTESRKNCQLAVQFKPEIASSQEAYSHSVNFFKGVLKIRPDMIANTERVIVGVPCEADDVYKRAVMEAVREAGYGENVDVKHEPKGALIYHVFNKDISPEEGLGGVLVVDFGGGTCDFAFMYNGEPKCGWGDFELGGRLFDDVFFQWFIDQNPKTLKKIRKNGEEVFFLFFECRELKERFSAFVAQDRKKTIPALRIRGYGVLRNLTLSDFIQRARNYKPSPVFMEIMETTGICPELHRKALKNETVDLIRWFRNALQEGMQRYGLENNIQLAILAGGSSQWVWVRDIIGEVCGPQVRIMQSNRPYVIIAEGLCIWPSLRNKLQQAQRKLQEQLPRFLKQELFPLVDIESKEFIARVSRSASVSVFEKVYPAFQEFLTEKSSLEQLIKRLSANIQDIEPQLRNELQKDTRALNVSLSAKVNQSVRNWFQQFDLYSPDLEVKFSEIGQIKSAVDARGWELGTIGRVVGDVVVMAAVAMICGGGGTALITGGPIGLAIGAFIGFVINRGLLNKAKVPIKVPWKVKESVATVMSPVFRRTVEKVKLPPRIKKLFFTRERISQMQEDTEQYLKQELGAKLKEEQGRIEKLLEERLKIVINSLSELTQI